MPAISLSEDGVLGRGVCVRAERVQREAACPGFCPCLLLGAGEGQLTRYPPKPSPAAPALQIPVQEKPVPRQVDVGHTGAPRAWLCASSSLHPADGPRAWQA